MTNSEIAIVITFLVSTLLSLRISIGLLLLDKYKDRRFVARLFWAVVMLIPILGPLFYGAFFRIPSRHEDCVSTISVSGAGEVY